MVGRHALCFEERHCPITYASDTDREIAELKDWVIPFTCVAHAASRALKWCLKNLVVGGDQMVEDIHISISALLRASTGLSQVVPEFIAGYVDFDRAEPSNLEEIEMLGSFLDIAPQDLALFTEVNLLWTGQRLGVSASLPNDSDCVACLTTVINYCV